MFPELRQNRPAFVRKQMLVNRAQNDEIVLSEICGQRVARRRLQKGDVFQVKKGGATAGDAERGFDQFDARDTSARKHSRENMRRRAAAAAELKNRFIFEIFRLEI